MIAPRPVRRPLRRQAGYALLLVMFLAAVVFIVVLTAVPSVLTEGRREKETELIWRGGQYTRAIRLFYRKYGRFPQSVDDLTKAKNEIRFLRKTYNQPMNREDGTWRFIYIGPSGQLIGSVRPHALVPAPGSPQLPRPLAAVGHPSSTAPVPPGGQPAEGQPASPANPANPPSDNLEGRVFGGSIIGVASKVKRHSVKIYEGADTYYEWEFIWDPTKDAVVVGQPPAPGTVPPVTAAPHP